MNQILKELNTKYSKKQLNSLFSVAQLSIKILNTFVEESPSDIELSDVIKALYSITIEKEQKEEQKEIEDLILKHAI